MDISKFEIREVHISTIKAGDTILHLDGLTRTVCENNIRRGGFMGTSLFGDCYKLGKISVKKVLIEENRIKLMTEYKKNLKEASV